MKILVSNITVGYKNSNNNKNITKQTLILHISNNQFSIFSDTSIRPLIGIKKPKYISNTNTKIIINDTKKKLTYDITLHNIYNVIDINDNKISSLSNGLLKKEENIKEDVINNFTTYFPEIKIISTEYVTPYGNIDILGVTKQGLYVIIELKKKSTDFNTIDQVVKYGKYFEENNKNIELYIMGIKNNSKNIDYAKDNNVKIIEY